MNVQKNEKMSLVSVLFFSKNTSKWSDLWGAIYQLWRVDEGVSGPNVVITEGAVKGLLLNLRVRW